MVVCVLVTCPPPPSPGVLRLTPLRIWHDAHRNLFFITCFVCVCGGAVRSLGPSGYVGLGTRLHELLTCGRCTCSVVMPVGLLGAVNSGSACLRLRMRVRDLSNGWPILLSSLSSCVATCGGTFPSAIVLVTPQLCTGKHFTPRSWNDGAGARRQCACTHAPDDSRSGSHVCVRHLGY